MCEFFGNKQCLGCLDSDIQPLTANIQFDIEGIVDSAVRPEYERRIAAALHSLETLGPDPKGGLIGSSQALHAQA